MDTYRYLWIPLDIFDSSQLFFGEVIQFLLIYSEFHQSDPDFIDPIQSKFSTFWLFGHLSFIMSCFYLLLNTIHSLNSRCWGVISRVMCFHPWSDITLPLMSHEEIAAVIKEWVKQFEELSKTYRWVQVWLQLVTTSFKGSEMPKSGIYSNPTQKNS